MNRYRTHLLGDCKVCGNRMAIPQDDPKLEVVEQDGRRIYRATCEDCLNKSKAAPAKPLR